jgi:hypothetical protein
MQPTGRIKAKAVANLAWCARYLEARELGSLRPGDVMLADALY